jgi:PST family polysaccharide transporter
MRFSVVAGNDVIARTVSLAVSILLAWAGWGYWALVAGAIAQQLSASIGAWTLCRWVPSLPRRAAGTASILRFAMNVYARFGLGYFSRNTDNLLVGWRFNAQALGFYKKAYDIFVLPAGQLIDPVANVALSTLSRLNRDPIRFRQYLMNSLAIIAFVGMAVGADLTLVGKDVIRLLFGPRWDESGRIFTFFAPGIGLMLLYSVHGWIHLSIGRPDRWLRWSLLEFATTALLFFLALRWGPVGIAMAWSVSFWILTLPALWYAGRPIQFGISPVLRAVWRYAFAALLAGGASVAIIPGALSLTAAASAEAALARIVVISATFGALYLGAVILLHGGYAPLRELVRLLRELAPSGRPAGPVPAVTASRTVGASEGGCPLTVERGGSQRRVPQA